MPWRKPLKLELLIGDLWGLAYVEPGASPSDSEATALDEAARRTQVDDPSALRHFYEARLGLRVPETFAPLCFQRARVPYKAEKDRPAVRAFSALSPSAQRAGCPRVASGLDR